jgi:hypothetical protein
MTNLVVIDALWVVELRNVVPPMLSDVVVAEKNAGHWSHEYGIRGHEV